MSSTPLSTDDWLLELFTVLLQEPDGPRPDRKIAIISTPRCGSKLFCDFLRNSGRFGNPKEWMNMRYLSAYARLTGQQYIDVARYLEVVMAKTTTANGVFALNFHVEHYMFWEKQGIDLFAVGFDRVFRVYRRDRLAQALSLAKAWLTDQWSSKRAPRRDVVVADIQTAQILQALHMLGTYDDFYDANLAGRVDKEYAYEDFTDDAGLFRDVLDACGIDHEDITALSSDRSIQRGQADMERLAALKAYLGCR